MNRQRGREDSLATYVGGYRSGGMHYSDPSSVQRGSGISSFTPEGATNIAGLTLNRGMGNVNYGGTNRMMGSVNTGGTSNRMMGNANAMSLPQNAGFMAAASKMTSGGMMGNSNTGMFANTMGNSSIGSHSRKTDKRSNQSDHMLSSFSGGMAGSSEGDIYHRAYSGGLPSGLGNLNEAASGVGNSERAFDSMNSSQGFGYTESRGPMSNRGTTSYSSTDPFNTQTYARVSENEFNQQFEIQRKMKASTERIGSEIKQGRQNVVRGGLHSTDPFSGNASQKLQREMYEARRSKYIEEEVKQAKALAELKRAKELEEARRAKALEVARRAKVLEEAKRAKALEEERIAKALEEERRAKALEEERRANALEEARRANAMEQARANAMELARANAMEQARRANAMEQARRAKAMEEAKTANALVEARIAKAVQSQIAKVSQNALEDRVAKIFSNMMGRNAAQAPNMNPMLRPPMNAPVNRPFGASQMRNQHVAPFRTMTPNRNQMWSPKKKAEPQFLPHQTQLNLQQRKRPAEQNTSVQAAAKSVKKAKTTIQLNQKQKDAKSIMDDTTRFNKQTKSCVLCRERFTTHAAFYKHMKRHKPGEESVLMPGISCSEIPSFCSTCSDGFSEETYLAHTGSVKHRAAVEIFSHMDINKEPAVEPEGVDNILPVDGFTCKLCYKFFTNKDVAYEIHCKSVVHQIKLMEHKFGNFSEDETKDFIKELCQKQGIDLNDDQIMESDSPVKLDYSPVQLDDSPEQLDDSPEQKQSTPQKEAPKRTFYKLRKQVYIGNLPRSGGPKRVWDLFKEIDVPILGARKVAGKTYGHADLAHPADMPKVFAKLKNYQLDGRILAVNSGVSKGNVKEEKMETTDDE